MTNQGEKAYLKRLDENFIVEASAGTGKTRAILDRAEFLVDHDQGFPMSQLAAITFTEKAAAELRNKLRRRLEAKAAKALQSEQPRIQKLLSEFEQAQISTIHSFCAHLLRLRPIEAGISPAFKMMDEADSAALFDRVWDKWLESNLVNNPGFFTRLRSMEIPVSDLKFLAKKLYHNRDLLKGIDGSLAEEDFKRLLKDAGEAFARLFIRTQKEVKGTSIKVLPEFMERMKELLNSEPEKAEEVWLKIDYAGITKPWKSNPAAVEIREEMTGFFKRIRAHALALALEEIKRFITMLGEEKERLEILDFQDLLIKARDLVKKDRVARDYFRKRFNYILVDEFQDTDPVQVELVFLLAGLENDPADNWRLVKLKPGKLFLVGDPKQSIYRFRRADLEIYELAKKTLLENSGKASEVMLDKNYRSHPGILDWVNITFENLIRKQSGFQPEYKKLVPGEPGAKLTPPLEKPVIVLELEKDPSLPPQKTRFGVENVRIVEARAVADFIQWSIENQLQVWETGDKSRARPAKYSDFAVLYGKHKYIQYIREEFRSRNIPFQMEASQEFLKRDEIAGLRAILSAIVNPLDQVALVSSLRSLFLAVSDLELLEFARDKGTWNWLETKPDPGKHGAIADAYEFLKELYNARDRKPITWIIEQLILRSRIGLLKTLHPQFNQALLNIERIKAASRSFDQDPAAGIFDFITWMENLGAGEDSSWPELMADKASNAVSIMTYFKSKGLEFPIVILANLSNALPAGGDVLIKNWKHGSLAVRLKNFQTLNYQDMDKNESIHIDCQNIRNLYVAATRAKQYIVIPDHRAIDKCAGQYMEKLSAGLPEPGKQARQLAEMLQPRKASEFKLSKQALEKSRLEIFSSLKPAPTEIEKGKAEFEKELQQKIHQAKKYVELTAPSKEELFEEFDPEKAGARDQALEIGSIAHKVIEYAGKENLETALLLAQSLAQESAREKALPQIQELVRAFFESELKAKIDSGDCFQELPFLIEFEHKLYRGKIDLVLREKNSVILVDFKTDRITKEEADARAKKYQRQMQIYAEAVSRIKNHQLAETSIYFLKPRLKKEL